MPAGVRSGLRPPPPERLFARCTGSFTGGEFLRALPDRTMDRKPRRLRGLPDVEADGTVVPLACTKSSRALGLALLGRHRAGEGLLIPRCRAVHTFGMRFALDLVFIDSRGLTVRRLSRVPPRRFVFEPAADRVLELPSDPA